MRKDSKPLKKENKGQNLLFALVFAFTLGLAPFVPEPHIVGKISWLLGGAEGMQAMDYFDLLLHGAPWLYLIYAIVQRLRHDQER
ncbi:hypothetical protein OKW21_004068 [Catalinimonas alkaloidigena]|uniref:hypothetical protein n=1 Tax=Catalinimonas alkaloidigena TaxID=1075417 RepID=UPI0024055F7D|nr:hypothetical protein [Catalinimonas alkaloidigena]MDF9798805.1 hypothetical protein [Catalinimonas alkaloidigena]